MKAQTWDQWVTEGLFKTHSDFKRFLELLPDFQAQDFREPETRQKNIEALKKKSSLFEQIIINKGGWLMPEKIYLGSHNHVTSADDYCRELDDFLEGLGMAKSLKTRFEYVSEELLPAQISSHQKDHDKTHLISFGSGTGLDVLRAMQSLALKKITADFYDINELALATGRKHAQHMGLKKAVSYHLENFTESNPPRFDIGLLIGIICPLPDPIAKRVLKSISSKMDNASCLVISTPTEKMAEDSLGRFLIEYISDWYLQYRTPSRVERLMSESGLALDRATVEPMGYHRLLVCTKAK